MIKEIKINKINVFKSEVEIHETKIACSNCNVHALCMPAEAASDFIKKLDELVYVRRRLKAGNSLYHSGDRFQALYAVKTGFIKTESLHDDGRVQITGFYMAGEIFGFDGIATEEHMSTSVALEDSEICICLLYTSDAADE